MRLFPASRLFVVHEIWHRSASNTLANKASGKPGMPSAVTCAPYIDTIEFRKRLQLPAPAAHSLRIRITAGTKHVRPNVKQLVIRVVLADHQVSMGVVPFVFIDVVDLSAKRHRLSKSPFGNQDVFEFVDFVSKMPHGIATPRGGTTRVRRHVVTRLPVARTQRCKLPTTAAARTTHFCGESSLTDRPSHVPRMTAHVGKQLAGNPPLLAVSAWRAIRLPSAATLAGAFLDHAASLS
jgi:hypothetical protein